MRDNVSDSSVEATKPPGRTMFGHPRGLFVLFLAEMWERFCYYGMRGLLTLYLTKALLMGDSTAFGIYGAYTALVYAAPVLGGKIADELLGYRRAVVLGGLLMAAGEFVLLGGNEFSLYVGMGLIIVGNGYFKANISSIVGRLYEDGDPRRDSGFTIFYMGINLGALLATTLCAWVGETFGYHYGFGLAGIGMLLGVAVFLGGRNWLEGHGQPPDPERLYGRSKLGISRYWLTVLLSVAAVPALYLMLRYNQVVGWLLALVAVYVVGNLLVVGFKSGRVQRDRIIVLLILMVFNIVFWACFEQAGTSLTLFADRNVDRYISFLDWEMGAAMTQFFNPFYILVFGSIFSAMWIKLERSGLNPNIPMKFGLGIVQLGGGYLLLLVGAQLAGESALVPLWILGFMYLLHTTGELFLSPIGLSMVTKLAPKSMTGTVMGAWFLSFAGSNYVAALLAKLTGGEEGGGEEKLTGTMEEFVTRGSEMLTDPFWAQELVKAQDSLSGYVDIYGLMGWITLGIGVFLVLISWPLNKMMHGVK